MSKTNGTYRICTAAGFSGDALLLEHAMPETFCTRTSQPHFFSGKCCSASRPEAARVRKEDSFPHLMLGSEFSLLACAEQETHKNRAAAAPETPSQAPLCRLKRQAQLDSNFQSYLSHAKVPRLQEQATSIDWSKLP